MVTAIVIALLYTVLCVIGVSLTVVLLLGSVQTALERLTEQRNLAIVNTEIAKDRKERSDAKKS